MGWEALNTVFATVSNAAFNLIACQLAKSHCLKENAVLRLLVTWGLLAMSLTAGAVDLDAWASAAKRRVIEDLKDPKSAQFRRLYISEWSIQGRKALALCGEVNARNSYGGYTGFQRFIADKDGVVFDKELYVWDDICARKIKTVN